jgi:hypothetical protein
MRPPIAPSRLTSLRALHTTTPHLAAQANLPPPRVTAADLGFGKRNEGRKRELPKFDIPASTHMDIGLDRPIQRSQGNVYGGQRQSQAQGSGGGGQNNRAGMNQGQNGDRRQGGQQQQQHGARSAKPLRLSGDKQLQRLSDATRTAPPQVDAQAKPPRERRPLSERVSIPPIHSTTPSPPADAPITPVSTSTSQIPAATSESDFFEITTSSPSLSTDNLPLSLFEAEPTPSPIRRRAPVPSPSARDGQSRPFDSRPPFKSNSNPNSPRSTFNANSPRPSSSRPSSNPNSSRPGYNNPSSPFNSPRRSGPPGAVRKPRQKTARPTRVSRTGLSLAKQDELRSKPAPPPLPLDQSKKAMFGQASVLLKGVRGSRNPSEEIWAAGLNDAEGECYAYGDILYTE